MTEAAFAELVSEVRHLRRIPKPMVVRPINASGKYVIVDGEHSWRAAREVGLEAVHCEIVDVDNFEAMRQTYKRNQHGSHNPVLLGQMFRQMMQERGISKRELGKEIAVSEGTVRNAINYARAASLRNDYAFHILTNQQVRTYLKLPPPINDLWLDAGANPSMLDKAVSVSLGKFHRKRGQRLAKSIDSGIEYFQFLADTGYYATIDSNDFVATTQRAFHLMEWEFTYRVENVREYVLVVAQLKLPVGVLFEVPLSSSPNDKNRYPVLISPEKWKEILSSCLRTNDEREQIAIAQAARRVLLKELDIADMDLTDPRTVEIQTIINDAPDFIREADLELREKAFIADAYNEELPDELMLAAKQLAVERLATRKKLLESGNADALQKFRPILTQSVERILDQALRESASKYETKQQQHNKLQVQLEAEELLSKPQEVATALSDRLASTSLERFLINKRPAAEVLVARLCSLPLPELKLIAAHLLGHREIALKVWFATMRKDCDVEELTGEK
jgi:hypothetical protein